MLNFGAVHEARSRWAAYAAAAILQTLSCTVIAEASDSARPIAELTPTASIRVADIQARYELWRSRGAEFITAPKDKYGETRCYIREPDGYIVEVGRSKPDFTYG
jgi:hypothetical protein